MKFFGWGRRNETLPAEPTHHEEAKKSDVAARATHGPGTAKWRSPDRVEQDARGWPSKAANFGRDAFPRDTAPGPALAWSEERLQETIRFVFSHEQEGLLAIGTFALDQLAGACAKYPASQSRKPPSIAVATDRSIQILLQELRSSDESDESLDTESHGLYSPIPLTSACKKKDLPVFGDHEAFCDVHSAIPTVDLPAAIKPKDPPSSDSEPPRYNAPGVVSKRDDLELQISHSRDSKPNSAIAGPDDERADDEFQSRGFACGLLGFRSSRRAGSKTADLGEKEKRKKLPPEKEALVGDNGSDRKRATGRKGLASKVGRLWRSGCKGPPSAAAEVAPEPEPEPDPDLDEEWAPPPLKVLELVSTGPPCIANVEWGGGPTGAPTLMSSSPLHPKAEGRRSHTFGKGTWACAQNGKWIRTDSEFVVLEM